MAVAKTFDRAWWADFFNSLPDETQKATVELADTIGQSLGEVVQPTASAVSRPIFAVAAVLAGAAVLGWIFRDEIKHFAARF